MQRILDKILLLTCSSILYYFTFSKNSLLILVPVLIVTALCTLGTFFKNLYLNFAMFFIYLGICCFFPLFTIFIPVMIYEVEFTVFKWTSIFCILPFILFWDSFSSIIVVFTALFFALAVLLCYKTSSIELLQYDYEAFRKTAIELSFVQEEKNKSILENQDYQIETATLNERNRISKEIHDHIGHLLSRSLIQIGALLTISKEEPVKEGLTDLKVSISEGMDSVRASIHNMHDESIDLNWNIDKLVRDFTFAPIHYEYRLHFAPPLKLKYCFIAITKESLANIEKHGKGVSNVFLSIDETDSDYLLNIKDNGIIPEKTTFMIRKSQSRMEYPEGLGLQSMSDRVKSFNGRLQIFTENGFEIQITIPKEDNDHETITCG